MHPLFTFSSPSIGRGEYTDMLEYSEALNLMVCSKNKPEEIINRQLTEVGAGVGGAVGA